MNNLTLGNEAFTYYETLGGGQGACADADGPSAVHVAMSNTLNTPVEALELEFPLRVVRVRGAARQRRRRARHRGGDGVVREFEALAAMAYSVIAERRRHAPPGADGWRARARGQDADQRRRGRPRRRRGTLAPGDRLRLETPGGGGHGGRPRTERAPAVRRGPAGPATAHGVRLRAMRVGWIGLGIMGSRMAANLRRAGHELVVHNRTRETAEAWAAEHGAEVAATPAEIRAEVVITMLVDGPQVEEALLGPDGAARDAGRGTLFVDMSHDRARRRPARSASGCGRSSTRR